MRSKLILTTVVVLGLWLFREQIVNAAIVLIGTVFGVGIAALYIIALAAQCVVPLAAIVFLWMVFKGRFR